MSLRRILNYNTVMGVLCVVLGANIVSGALLTGIIMILSGVLLFALGLSLPHRLP